MRFFVFFLSFWACLLIKFYLYFTDSVSQKRAANVSYFRVNLKLNAKQSKSTFFLLELFNIFASTSVHLVNFFLLHVNVCSSHVYLLSDHALFLRRLKGLWKQFIPGSNGILKWQHTGAICAVLAPFVSSVQI